MKRFILFALAIVVIVGCGFPQETRRGVGNEGFLVIIGHPDDAEVYVDGVLAGQAGQVEKNPLEMKSGTHKIELRKSGFVPEMHEVYVGNQSRHTLKVNLKKSQ